MDPPSPSYEYDYDFQHCLSTATFAVSRTPFTYIDIQTFVDDRPPVVRTGEVFEKDVRQWAEELGSLHASRSSIPTLIEISRDVFAEVVAAFSLPPPYLRAVVKDIAILGRFSQQDPDRTGYVLKLSSGVVLYVNGLYTHFHDTATSTALIRTNFSLGVLDLIPRLEASAMLASHPLLLSLVYAEWQLSMLSDTSVRIGDRLLGVEARTGHTVVLVHTEMPNLGNNQDLTTYLSRISYAIAAAQLFAGSLRELCSFISESLDCITTAQQQRASFARDDRLMCHVLLKIATYEKRAQFQLSTIYNLIARQDSAYARSIARASKRDSTSMKTIAVLTTSFLPATWVSAFFSMPLFNWSAESSNDVLAPRFWVYWALTLPLTIVVMALWWVWMTLRERRFEIEDLRDRVGFWNRFRKGCKG
ncbi:hypothetical protein MMC13_007204 [Lambiella insularis]|nr:hypothetical protein [Lambiella insularis]